jgi:ribonuclease HII
MIKQKTTVCEIKERLHNNEITQEMLEQLASDSRISIRKLIASYLKKQKRGQEEQARLERMWRFELEYRLKGYELIAGVDEVGRGPLAGPVISAAVVLPLDFDATGLNDSKQLNAKQRIRLKTHIEQDAISIGIGIVDVEYIDQYNILQATYHAMRKAVNQLTPHADMILVDAVQIPGLSIFQQGIVKGDQLSHSIAAASIIAKITRDTWMIDIAKKYPEYGFEQHMGYGTPQHLQAIHKWGPTPIHRRSFSPICQIIKNEIHKKRGC